MTNKLSSPTKQLSSQNNLPGEWKGEGIGDKTGSDPAEESEKSSERTSLYIQSHVEEGVEDGGEEAPIENEHWGKEAYGEKGGGEVEDHLGGEEDGPNKEDVDGHVDGVTVIRAIEGKVLL